MSRRRHSRAAGPFDRAHLPAAVLALLLAADVRAGTDPPPVSFRAAVRYPITGLPADLTVVDLDLDDELDVAVASYDTSAATLLLGDGDGRLRPGGDAPTVGKPLGITAGRLDSDLLPDLVLTEEESDNMWFLRNRGGGLFDAPRKVLGGHDPWPVVAVDFDGDGALDLVQALAGELGGRINVLYGNGQGAFDAPVGTRTRGGNQSLVVADFNGDDLLDAAAANGSRASVSVVLGGENRTLVPQIESAILTAPTGLAAGYVDDDDVLDVVATAIGGTQISLSYGLGDGRFAPAQLFRVGQGPIGVALADLDGDERLNAIVANSGSNTISVLFGNDLGGFLPVRNFVTDGMPIALRVIDLNGDDFLDIVSANNGVGGVAHSATVLFGNGSDLDAARLLPGAALAGPVAVGDLNNDGRADLAASATEAVAVATYLGRSDGTFNAPHLVPLPGAPSAVVLADVNGDDRPDLVTAESSATNLALALNRGSAFAATVPLPTGGAARAVAAADYDGDGAIDLAAALPGSNEVSVLRGSGTGGFAAPVKVTLPGSPVALASGDFDGNARADVAVLTTSPAGVTVLLGSATGMLTVAGNASLNGNPIAFALLDADDDGDDDVAATYAPHALEILLSNGAGSFSASRSSVPGLSMPVALTARDVNGDRRADLLVADNGTASIAVFAATGAAAFAAPIRYSPGALSAGLAVGDFDGDGGYDFTATGTGSATGLNAISAFSPGDANGDDAVTAADLVALAGTLNRASSVPSERAASAAFDANGDGVVNRQDLRGIVGRIFG